MLRTVSVLLAVALTGAPAITDGHPNTGGHPDAAAQTVTLITGDQVEVTHQADGQSAIVLHPAAGRQNVGFERQAHGDHVSVVPTDAAALLAAGRLDPELFDVTALAKEGSTLPLILTYPKGLAPHAVTPAATTVRELRSINGSGIRVNDPAAFWAWLKGDTSVGKVWLDGMAQPSLDVSVPLIGAPTAWQAGFTGAGVTVGVLDSGMKADHPDLTGKITQSRDFTGTDPTAGDDLGHGTHVASIIAGTGAASGGRYRGVAPDAKLINAKVCTVAGCPDSAIIAAMEWVAPLAPVVNMSLGGGASDGADPISQAVNTLTAQYGTLFVAAAGNGGATGLITAPAAADSALAVGSTSKQDTTSPDSSLGPRLGDYAVKPDIAAPGDGIVAARAPGTPDGDYDPVDANYVRLSGTSMASPHVAGAAAILVQQHPDWKAGTLKPELMSTAKPVAGVYEEGGGRVDVARAVTQTVSATTGSLSYGKYAWPHNQIPATKTVTYRNDGADPVTLSLALSDVPAGMFTLSVNQITIAAHGTADVGVTMNPGVTGAVGVYGGRVTASAAGVAVQTAVGVYLAPDSSQLTVQAIGRSGGLAGFPGFGQAVDVKTGNTIDFQLDGNGVATQEVPNGTYDVEAVVESTDPVSGFDATLVARTDVTVSADSTVTLDARGGRLVQAVTDEPKAVQQFGAMGLYSAPVNGSGGTIEFAYPAKIPFYAVPTPKVTDHTFAFYYHANLATGFIGVDPTMPQYNLAFLEKGRIPADPSYRVHNSQLAVVHTSYATQGTASSSYRGDYVQYGVPGISTMSTSFFQALPSQRTEYYTASPDVTWRQLMFLSGPPGTSGLDTLESVRGYRPGGYRVSWNNGPIGPAFGDPNSGFDVLRGGNNLFVGIPLFGDSDPTHSTWPGSGITGSTTLSRDGAVLGSTTDTTPGNGSFPIPATAGTYTLHVTAARSVPWSVLATGEDVSWTFKDQGVGTQYKPLPLLVVRASGRLDDQASAPAGQAFPLDLLVQHQPGAASPAVCDLAVQVSFDDGVTWKSTPTWHSADRGGAVIRQPTGPAFASLRITARDVDGDSVTQTVIRAYRIG